MYKIIIAGLLVLWMTGCQNNEEEYTPRYTSHPPLQQRVYIFGVHPLHNPKRLFEVYNPMIEYINRRLEGGTLRLEASRDYDTFEQKLFSEKLDFALPNPYQTVKAAEKGYKIFAKMGDDQNFRGIILIRKDSGIKRVEDLKGKTISYPAPTALAATMMPQWFLHERGINIQKEIKNSYVGSQESSIMNVYLGKSAAGATWPPPWKAFSKARPEIAKELMVKWETFSLPNNGLVAHPEVPERIVDQVAQIITTMQTTPEGREILQNMELSRYERADDHTYEPVRLFLNHFESEVRPIRVTP